MHLIHKLRRSISHRPRHLYDLPDEILCLILEYCCQELDFLLWSCPLVTLESQFCHDCFHCTLCHGRLPARAGNSRKQSSRCHRSHQSHQKAEAYAASDSSTLSPSSEGTDSSSISKCHAADLLDSLKPKKRRRRCFVTTTCCSVSSTGSRINVNNRQCSATEQQHEVHGAKPCPRNGNRPWCLHMQHQNSTRIPLLWRVFPLSMARAGHVPQLPHPPIFRGIRMPNLSWPYEHLMSLTSSSVRGQLSRKLTLSGMADRMRNLAPLLFSTDHQQDTGGRRDMSSSSNNLPCTTGERAHSTIGLPPTSSLRSGAANGSGTGNFTDRGSSSLIRRRTLSMGTQATEPSGTIMSRSWSIGGTMQTPVFWRRDDRSESSEFGFDDSDSNSESEETKDDFDDSIHLAGPFQLLLVSRRLADAAIQSLWRNLVFHGHDVYQMQSLLSTLAMDDGVSGDHSSADSSHHPSGLEELKEVSEEDEDKDQNGKRKNHPGGEQDTLMDRNVVEMKTGPTAARCIVRSSNLGTNEHRLPRRSYEEHGATRFSWIESLNSSFKQFSKFQGVSGGYKPISQTIAAAPREPASHSNASLLSSRQPTTAGAHQRPISLGTHGKQGANSQRSSSRDDRHHSSQLSSSKSRQNETRWPYRRHVRRVVLNFAHPQASPQMLVKTLECLSQRCYGQILALDLHANEKMRDGGLEKLEEMERLFGYGFSKLRYLRLQGGFVDNQLLGSLIKGLTLPGPASLDHPSIGHARHYASPSPGSLPPYTASPCRLSQVFLGPGSVTDSAVDKLIAAAGHSLEVFVVTSCVDVGGGALASLLTKCRKLRVLSVHRSLARDRDLLEGLGIEVEALAVNHLHAEMTNVSSGVGLSTVGHVSSSRPASPSTPRPEIVAPLERLELGIVKLSRVGVTEILKGTCETLRYLVLETQHFSEELLTDVITPFCTRLEGLYFDDPEHLQRQQHQMQGLGFSVGRRGSHLPSRQFEFGRSRRTFYADPNRHYQPASQQHQQHFQHHLANPFMSGEPLKRKSSIQHNPKISAWLGETTTEEWIIYGDCALWTSAASPGISFNNGGAATGAQAPLNHHPRRQPLPLHHAYHSPEFLTSIEQASSSSSSRAAAYGMYQPNSFMGDYDDVLERYRVSRTTIENAMLSLQSLEAFTVVQLDFKLESQGVNERKALEWEDEMWRQSVGFRLLQVFYACLLLSPIFYGSLRW